LQQVSSQERLFSGLLVRHRHLVGKPGKRGRTHPADSISGAQPYQNLKLQTVAGRNIAVLKEATETIIDAHKVIAPLSLQITAGGGDDGTIPSFLLPTAI
jgi:hypothetical protein